ncbi:glycosyltransferase family 4 protein [Vibrio splendidus]
MAGPANVMFLTARMLSNEIETIVVTGGGELEEAFISSGIKTYTIPELKIEHRSFLNTIKAIYKIRRIINEENIDIIHGHNLISSFIAKISSLTNLRNIPTITTVHGVGKEGAFKFSPGKIIAVSNYVKHRLISSNVNVDKIEVIHNAFIKENVSDSVIGNENKIKLLSVAMMTGYKGHKKLIKSFHSLSQLHGNVELVLIGDGAKRQELEDYVEKFNISNIVHFLGTVPNAVEVMKDYDIFVHYSDYETFGMVILEAMSNGLPVVARKVGGIPEIVNNDKTGFLVDNEQELQCALSSLIEDKKIRERFGKNGLTRFNSEFSYQATKSKYLNLYKGQYHE